MAPPNSNSAPQARQDGQDGRKKGPNTGNFAEAVPNTTHDEAVSEGIVASAAVKPRRLVSNADLQCGDVIIGDDGSRNTVNDARSSSKNPGFMLVEFASGIHGLMDEDGESLVAASDEKHFAFTAETITEDDFSDLFALRYSVGRNGATVSLKRDVMDLVIRRQEDIAEDDESAETEVDYDKVLEYVEESDEWCDLGETMYAAVEEVLESAVRTAVDKVLAEQATSDEEMAFERKVQREGR